MKILGYKNIKVLKRFELEKGKSILLYESNDSNTKPKYGILFEKKYTGDGSYDKERSGAFVYKTLPEAIDEFSSRINHYLRSSAAGRLSNEIMFSENGCKTFIIISKLDDNDFQLWAVDIPEKIFKEYETEGSSVCGTAEHIIKEASETIVAM